jgi:hypothetical protein
MPYNRRTSSPHPHYTESAHDWPPDPTHNVNVERVYLSWPFVKVVSAVIAFAAFCIYITAVTVNFYHQAEVFRHDVSVQIKRLNENIVKIGHNLNKVANSPNYVKVRDLWEFCIELERSNQESKFTCPYISKTKHKSIQAKGWVVEK